MTECSLELNAGIAASQTISKGRITETSTRVDYEFICNSENCPRKNGSKRFRVGRSSRVNSIDFERIKGGLSREYGDAKDKCAFSREKNT